MPQQNIPTSRRRRRRRIKQSLSLSSLFVAVVVVSNGRSAHGVKTLSVEDGSRLYVQTVHATFVRSFMIFRLQRQARLKDVVESCASLFFRPRQQQQTSIARYRKLLFLCLHCARSFSLVCTMHSSCSVFLFCHHYMQIKALLTVHCSVFKLSSEKDSTLASLCV